MLVTFHTTAYADIILFGDVAIQLLKMMGHSGTVPGALLAEDVPAALAQLKEAIAAHKANPKLVPKPVKPDPTDQDQDEDEEKKEPPVDLSHRALPLIELLEAATAANANVMWN